MKNANRQITCWYPALEPLKFEVVPRLGAHRAVVDHLSYPGGGGRGRVSRRFDGSPASTLQWGCDQVSAAGGEEAGNVSFTHV